MTAPWVMDMKYMAELDAAEVNDYARERAAAAIAADPYLLAGALCYRDDDSPLLIGLSKALVAGDLALIRAAVQALADDAALEF